MRFGSAIKALDRSASWSTVSMGSTAPKKTARPYSTWQGRTAARPSRKEITVSACTAQPSTEVKANSPRETLTSRPAHGPSTVPKARMVNAAPVRASPCASGSPSTPEQQMARPVTVQITVVSKKTPVMLISPCRTGLSVSAQAAVMVLFILLFIILVIVAASFASKVMGTF